MSRYYAPLGLDRPSSLHLRSAAPPPTHLMMLVRVGVLVTTVHVHFLHHFLMRLGSAPYKALVFVRCEFRHFAEERHDVPQQFIIVHDAPGRHARHFDPMFYDPKLFRRREPTAPPEFGRSRIKTPTDLGPLHTGSEMAGAAHFLVLHSTGGNALGVTQINGNSVSGVSRD